MTLKTTNKQTNKLKNLDFEFVFTSPRDPSVLIILEISITRILILLKMNFNIEADSIIYSYYQTLKK